MRRAWIVGAVMLVACTKKGGEERASPSPGDQGGTGRTGTGDAPKEGKGGIIGGTPGFTLDLDGEMEATGAIDKGAVRKVVKDNVTKLQACYEQTLMANPGIAGTVTATFTIDNGSVTNIKASGVHPDVETCVVKAVQLFKFPPGEKVDVSYPFTFKPAS